jgi:hypothetical protein
MNIKELANKLKPLISKLQRYIVLIFIAVLVGMYGFLVLRINQFSAAEPSDEAVTEKLQGSQRPRIDQSMVDKITQLQGQNIEVQSLFKQARDNPFNE